MCYTSSIGRANVMIANVPTEAKFMGSPRPSTRLNGEIADRRVGEYWHEWDLCCIEVSACKKKEY